MNWIEEKIDEYGSKFYPTVGYNRYHEEAEWICTALKEAHQRGVEEGRLSEIEANVSSDIQIASDKAEQLKERGREEERKRVLEWAKDKKHNKVYKLTKHNELGTVETITIPDSYDSAFRLGESITLDDIINFINTPTKTDKQTEV